ncbi:DUF1566 domain-containing protein [uncultured Alistipes sp.]|uniref:BF2992 family fimbrillin-A clan protein n=1 Tax=uncultured Alistipes sp. TaxID=538949 RepID=UPI002586AD09|nr:DUF1566 domain-containing protein [uncultured Alistipes sp.]
MEMTRIKNKGVRARLAAGAWLFAAVLLLGGCSKEPAEGMDGPSGQVALDFSIEGIEKMLPATKAALATGTTVRVIAYKSGDSNPATENYANECAYYWNGTKLVPCMVDANGNKTADLPDWAMTLLPGSYDFYAVSPALPLAADKTKLATAIANGVDYAASDKTTGTISIQTTPYAITLNELQRKCARLTFVVRKEDYVSSDNIRVLSFQVKGLAAARSGVTVGGDIAPASSGTQSLELRSYDFTVSGTTATQDTPSVVLPLSGAALSLQLDVIVDGTQWKPPFTGMLSCTLEKGKAYTITVTFAEIMEITLSEWDAENGNNPDLGDHYPYVSDGNTIVMQDRYGFAQRYSLHAPWTQTPAHAEPAYGSNNSGLNTCGQKFMVAKAHAKNSEGNQASMTWYSASGLSNASYNPQGYSACPQYSEKPDQSDKGMWRLPTIRELRVISDMSAQGKLTALNLPAVSYWSATARSTGSMVWYVNFSSNNAGNASFFNRYYVRCVRDL